MTIAPAPSVARSLRRRILERGRDQAVPDRAVLVLHDVTKPELYGGLPANPTIPVTYTIWKRVAKPVGLLLALLAAPVAFFHYITEGPKEPSPPR